MVIIFATIAIIIALIGAVVGIVIGVLNFQNMVSILEAIVVLISSFSAIICLALIFNSVSIGLLDGKVRKLLDQPPQKLRKNNRNTMPDALKEYSHDTGAEGGAGEAIRHLATEQLKYLGYLKR